MNILFVSSGNLINGINPIIKNQSNSLKALSINIDHYSISGKGLKGYLVNIVKLRQFLKSRKYDLIHGHYSFSGIVASLAFSNTPVIVSLMGSDVFQSKLSLYLIRFFCCFFWDRCLVKTTEMQRVIGKKNIVVLPNGVDLLKFQPENKFLFQEYLGWNKSKMHLFFCSTPQRYEKNYQLVESSLKLISEDIEFELHFAEGINNDEIAFYYNASDVILLSSLWEGSPNVIKEAMACNKPIVSTNVGDVEWLFGNEPGHFIADFTPNDFIEKLNSALVFSKMYSKTSGRERIISLGLDSVSVAKKLYMIYTNVLNESSGK